MPRRPTANRQHQLIQNVSKNVSCIVTGIKDAADRVDNQVHDLVDRLGHRPMLTRRAASSLNTCLSTWGITDDEFDNFFNHGLTGQTALHKLTLLARQVTWERAKELLTESHTTQRGWKVVGSGKNGIAKNTSKWTALEIDYALTHSTPDSPSYLVPSSPAQPSVAPDDHDSHEIQALENINSDVQDHDSPHVDNSNEFLDHSDVQDHSSPDIDNGDESLDHSDDRVGNRSLSPELQRGGCVDLPLYHNSSLVANDSDSSMTQDDSVLVEGYHGTQTPPVFHDSSLWADNPDLYMPKDDFMLGKGSHRTQRSSSTPLLGSLDMSGFRENSLGGESHTEVEHQACTPRPQDQSAVPQKDPESVEPRRSASTPPSQAQSRAPSTIKRKRSETFSPDLFKLDGWLSGDTVTKLLAIVSAGRPASIYAADTSLVVRPRSPFLNKLRSPDLTTVLLPLHLQNHWVLGSVSRDAGNIVLYDSMSTATHSAHAESLIREYLGDVCRIIDVPANNKPTSNDASSPVWLSQSLSLSLLDLHCPSQNNAHDCGVAVIVCAMHAVLGKHLPKWTTYGLWRDVFCVLLTDPTVPIQEDACFAGLLTRHWSTLMPDSEIELAVPPPHFPGTRHRYANLAKMTREMTNFTKKLQDKMDKDRETIRGHVATMSHIRDILRSLHDQMDVENEDTDVSRIRDALRKRREHQESFAQHLTPEELAPLRAVTIHEEERLQSVLDTASDAALRISRAITVVDHHLTELARAQEALLQA